MSRNKLTLKKGSIIPNQDLLEEVLGNFIHSSNLGKNYTIDHKKVDEFREKHKNTRSGVLKYTVHRDDGVYLLDDDFEIIIRKVSNKRKENEARKKVHQWLKNN